LYDREKKADPVTTLATEILYLFTDWFNDHIKEWDRGCAIFCGNRLDWV